LQVASPNHLRLDHIYGNSFFSYLSGISAGGNDGLIQEDAFLLYCKVEDDFLLPFRKSERQFSGLVADVRAFKNTFCDTGFKNLVAVNVGGCSNSGALNADRRSYQSFFAFAVRDGSANGLAESV